MLDPDTLVNVDPHDRIIALKPGESILAHTVEFIGGREHITTMMKARSTMGRCFITVCSCAGWGDCGFFDRWTMEITNRSQRHSVLLVVGERIAQIVFLDIGHIEGNDYAVNGSYQRETTLEGCKAAWRPSNMLPRAKRTRPE